ncbi:AfsR/SARP family transcriptional regulator [Actinophytocola gossypii]|uniref:Tetratricopeptide repeat protein n=1 Tax=Actinophytocola gossypii TaxID=2812003 RepID=A0ABT2JIF7_9PSEU|nr:BTAD domain-containing putative transcriptional regulator [Actinophytocola gossypii]MCT2587019.1 tetratricopeptide repeat protein [Actinophytocola gossypii]
MRFRLLGPLQVFDGTAWVTVGAAKVRLLLATLLVRANQTVPTETIVDELWGETPPKTATTQVHGYVLRLRRLLGEDVLTTVAPGYRLVVGAEDTDAQRFELLADQGHAAHRDSRPESSAEHLAEALALWRGPAFGDVPASATVTAEAERLTEKRLTALDTRVAADLDRGRHTTLIGELRRHVEEHPLRERAWAHLMLAQFRSGRQAEALGSYQRVRQVLVDELGVEPGADLRDLHRRILADDPTLALDVAPPAVVVPPICQLPADVPDFTGRQAQLDAIAAALADRYPTAPPPVWVISGGPGIGKSTLALHAARRAAPDFPDGQLYLDLTGTSPEPRAPAVLLAEVLHALGVTGAAVPDGLHARAALYRSLVTDRRMLLVLDDAASAEQVGWLQPPTGSCAAIVTSRSVLTDLPGARHTELDVLDHGEALDLFTRIVGAGRVEREPDDAAAILRACGHLPLAIRIAAGKLLGRPAWSLRVLRERLEDESRRLSELRLGELGVRASFDLSVRLLDEESLRALRLFGTLGPWTVPGWVLDPLLDRPADELLDTLVDANLARLVTTDASGQPRYRLHDLLRAYAAEGAEAIPLAERRDAVTRLLATWLDLTTRAADALPPSLFRPPPGTAPRRAAPAGVARRAEADPVTWFAAERVALLDGVRLAAEWGLAELAWELATVAVPYYDHHSRYEDWQHGHQTALAAVRRAGDRLGEAVLLRGLAQVQIYRDDFTPATANMERSAELFREVGDKLGEGLATAGLGTIHRVLDQHEQALDRAKQALELVTAAGDRHTEAQLMSAIGAMYQARDEVEQARHWFTEALTLSRHLGDAHREAVVLREMCALHEPGIALTNLRRAEDIFASLGDDRCVAYTLMKSGEIHLGRDDRARAVPDLEQAAEIFSRHGSRMDEARCWELLGDLDRARTLWRSVAGPGSG